MCSCSCIVWTRSRRLLQRLLRALVTRELLQVWLALCVVVLLALCVVLLLVLVLLMLQLRLLLLRVLVLRVELGIGWERW